MGTLVFSSPGQTPLHAASLAPDYPEFFQVAVPEGTGAVSAWQGYIKPFVDDAAARSYLRVVEADGQVQVSEGTLFSIGDHLTTHWAEPLLVKMAQRCKVLILDMPLPAHPRAYLLEPLYSSAFLSSHPHPRGDLAIKRGQWEAAGLCLYSAAEHSLGDDSDRLVTFLDIVSTHIARHLIWLRTRRLYEKRNGKLTIIHQPKPGEMIIDCEVGNRRIRDVIRFWEGYWPGKQARASTSADHVRKIASRNECWCGTGKAYEGCCRAADLARSGLLR